MNRSTIMKGLAAAVSAVVFASLAAAAYVLGSPAERRQIRLDSRRLQDIEVISDSIQNYAKKHGALPQDLATLQKEAEAESGTASRRPPVDPDTRAPYEYTALDAQSYQLCAVFSLPSPDENDRTYYDRWRRAHDAGRQCFKYTRDDNSGKCR